MIIKIKGMVCRHCIQAVTDLLVSAGLTVRDVSLGSADIEETLDDDALHMLDSLLAAQGFSRPVSADEETVERIKRAVINHVRQADRCRLNLSACLEEHLHIPYDTLSRIFSSQEGRTVEKYQIAQRVEWVKELLGYGEMTVSEIAFHPGYSTAAHLSRQFKSVTGLTPTEYLRATATRRPLNEV